MADVDQTDLSLLALLQRDGQMSYSDLGRAVGLAPSTVNDRVRRLVEKGVIEGVHARLSPEALGLDMLAYVFVGWSDPGVEQPFLDRIAKEGAVQEAHHVTGAWNYLLKVRVAKTHMLEAFLASVIKSVPGIQRTETLIVLSSAKETSSIALTPPDWYRPAKR